MSKASKFPQLRIETGFAGATCSYYWVLLLVTMYIKIEKNNI